MSGRRLCPRTDGRSALGVGRAALGAIEDELNRGDLDPVSPRVLGAVARMIGLRQERRKIEHRIVRNDDADVSAPCANSMKIAGQRETRGSLRPRQNSNAAAQV